MTKDDLDVVAEAMAELTLGGSSKNQDKITEGMGLLLDTIIRLEARVAEIEEAGPAVRHCGVWKEGKAFKGGSLCTHQGGLWLARSDTTARPPDESWQLVVKAGHAGNGAERPRGRTGIRA